MKNFDVIDKADVVNFWIAVGRIYKTHTGLKKNSRWMKMIGRMIPGMSYRQWMSYTTTLSDRIYTSFPLGTSGHSFAWQIACCVHEHVHVDQWRKKKNYRSRYIFSTKWRARYEREAYAVEALVMRELTGKEPSAQKYAQKLKAYGCTGAQIHSTFIYIYKVLNGKIDCHPVGWRLLKMIGEG